MTEREAYLAFSTFPAIGPQRFKLLKEYFGGAKKAWEASGKQLSSLSLSTRLVESFEKHRKNLDLDLYSDTLKKLGISYVTVEDKEYPERLRAIDDAPFLLYVKQGDACKVSPCEAAEVSLAVVGTRKISSYGRDVTERLVAGLVDAGITIVSGLALGIDAVAHKTALDCGGLTVGVVGGGLDSIYPPSNRGLAEAMFESGQGIIVSEYPLGYPAMPANFPVRNRIVSGLTLGVLVIEGTIKSGTLLTAASAAKQGRDVFAVPGPITSILSGAPNLLIKNGAKLVEKAEDVLEELNIDLRIMNKESRRVLPGTPDEGKLLDMLEVEALGLDELVRMSGMETGVVLATLTGMELKGMVKNAGGTYRRNF